MDQAGVLPDLWVINWSVVCLNLYPIIDALLPFWCVSNLLQGITRSLFHASKVSAAVDGTLGKGLLS